MTRSGTFTYVGKSKDWPAFIARKIELETRRIPIMGRCPDAQDVFADCEHYQPGISREATQ